jgi:hypothetical protein
MAVLATPGSSVMQAPAVVTHGRCAEKRADASVHGEREPQWRGMRRELPGSLLITDEGEVDLNFMTCVISGDFTQGSSDW